MKTITKQDAARIAGLSPKTLERYCQEPEFVEKTGMHKHKISGRMFFDETKFRAYFADVTGNDDLRTGNDPQPGSVDGEIITDIVQAPAAAPVRIEPGTNSAAAELSRAFLIPHKLYLTLDEAKALTGFPKAALRKHSVLKHGRRVISRAKLNKL